MDKHDFIREACVDSLSDTVHAFSMGANRIELCSHLELDGLTPDIQLIKEVQNNVTIPLRIMIRPRAGDFVYSAEEVTTMIRQIDRCKELGVEGVVFGALFTNNRIDVNLTSYLARHAAPMKVTFHKAFDLCPDLPQALNELLDIPQITSILTSGGQPTAEQAIPVLSQLIKTATPRIEIIVAGKVTKDNILGLHQDLHAPAYHGRKITG